MKINSGQSTLEYAILIGVIGVSLSIMTLYFRRGIQAAVRVAADEVGRQQDAEDVDVFNGTTTNATFRQMSESNQAVTKFEGGSQTSVGNSFTKSNGTTSAFSEK